MIDVLRPILSRVLAAPIAAFCAYVFLKWKVDIDTATQQQLVEALVAFILPLFGVAYALIHKLLDKWINPADAASTTLAIQGRAQLKASRRL